MNLCETCFQREATEMIDGDWFCPDHARAYMYAILNPIYID